MKQLIYRSRPFRNEGGTLGEILMTAWTNNRLHQISGALICRDDLFLQLIEGPDDKIDALYANIKADKRHTDVRTLVEAQVNSRILAAWSMLDARTVPEDRTEIAVDSATPDQLRAMFERIAAAARDIPE